MAGCLKGEQASPVNTAVRDALNALLTPYLTGRLGVWSAEEMLRVLGGETESPILVWNDAVRAELLDYLNEQRREHLRCGHSEPSFGAAYVHRRHAHELVVGGVFVGIFNRQSDFPLEEPADFALNLLRRLAADADEVLLSKI